MASASSAERAGCAKEHRAYLSCVGSQRAACPPASLAAGVALETGAAAAVCSAEHAAYFRCTDACREAGVVRTRSATLPYDGQERTVHAELVGAGCGETTPAATKKQPPGSPCTHHSVCSASPCSCPERGVHYVARACVNGRCAPAAVACALAPIAVAHDPCHPPQP